MKCITTLLATDGEPAVIAINAPVERAETLHEQDERFAECAIDLELALFQSLPGGLYDRLLGAMLARKATSFIVRHR